MDHSVVMLFSVPLSWTEHCFLLR